MTQIPQKESDPRTYAIIGAAMEVHRNLGNGFLEAVYQEALEKEFRLREIPGKREVELPIFYKGERLGLPYRVDFICYEEVLVELKALGRMGNTEEAQVLHYLRASGLSVGLLINFGRPNLEYKRFVNSQSASSV